MVGLGGVAALVVRSAFPSPGADSGTVARRAGIAAAGCYAIGWVITRLSPPSNQLSFGAGALIAATCVIVPVALIWEPLPTPDPTAVAAVFYLGLFPTALATLILVRVITSAGPTFLTQVNYQVPIWSVLFGPFLLHEPLPPTLLGALVLILAGLAISRAPLWRRRP